MPYNYLTVDGSIVADTSTLKAEVQGEYVSAFGPSLILADDTPQGRLIDVETTARDGIMRLAAELANQINPNFSSGIYLESIASLHNVVPTPERFTVVRLVLLTGTPGTTIASGSRVADRSGNFYRVISQVSIGVSEEVLATCQAEQAGPIAPAIGDINTIIDGVLGWATVSNTAAVDQNDLGSLASSDAALRQARNDKLSLLGKGTIEAVFSNVMAVRNVRSITARENTDAFASVIDGVSMTPNSFWCCVQGGIDADIALALLASKQTGSPYTSGIDNGTPVSISIIDPISGQLYPVIFTRQIDVPINVRVTVASGSTIDATVAVPNAVLAYANGQVQGERGFINGAAVSPFEIAAAINFQEPQLFIKRVEIGTVVSDEYEIQEIPMALWEAATVSSGNITVVVS